MRAITISLVFGLLLFSCSKARVLAETTPADSAPVNVVLPLSPEAAAALLGVGEQEELEADVYVNEELVAEGIRGGVRSGRRGEEASGIRGGIRAGRRGDVESGIRGGRRGAAARSVRRWVRGTPSRVVAAPFTGASSDTGIKPAATLQPQFQELGTRNQEPAEGDIAFAFEITFLLPQKSARDGANSIRTRVRPGKHQDVPLVEVKTTVKIKVSSQQSAVSGQPGTPSPSTGEGSGGGAPGGVTGSLDHGFTIEVEDTPLSMNDVELPDLDGDGIATLTEVASLIGTGAVAAGFTPASFDQAIAAAADPASKPTEAQAQKAFEDLAKKLEQKVVADFKSAGIPPAAEVKIELKQVDLTPPDTFVSAEALGAGREAQAGQDITFTFTCTETACVFRCALDDSAFAPCPASHVLRPASGEHKFAVAASDAMGNRDPSPAALTFTVLPSCVPTPELCDGKDNDCDGVVDEDLVGAGAPFTGASSDAGIKPATTAGTCDTGLPGVCAEGTQTCVNGALACAQTTSSSIEVCDSKDNDCDGTTDEDIPSASCSTGNQGVCSEGTQTCVNGALTCVQRLASSVEICDAKDNDCNGKVDDAIPSASCATGGKGVCAAGTTVCSNGTPVCSQTTASSAETCDGLDNDCNGTVDDGITSTSCTTGLQGVCSAGTTACSNGSSVCSQTTASSSEKCDALDNDCDGSTD
ncbi:MAG: putative metal-binding motif-containing protein, partial [Nitrospirae bacterium]|nr:putative metal-binding motif-containing protein [Nitrospirota bacterium]